MYSPLKIQRFALWSQVVSVFLGKMLRRSPGGGLSLGRLGRVSKRDSSGKCHLKNSGGAAAQAMCWSDKHVLWRWDVKSTGTGPLIHGTEHSLHS